MISTMTFGAGADGLVSTFVRALRPPLLFDVVGDPLFSFF